jgi:hypothetical protein
MFEDECQKETNEACASVMYCILNISKNVLEYVKLRENVN